MKSEARTWKIGAEKGYPWIEGAPFEPGDPSRIEVIELAPVLDLLERSLAWIEDERRRIWGGRTPAPSELEDRLATVLTAHGRLSEEEGKGQ